MTEQVELAVQIARIDENVTEIHHRLFGNGQPGLMDRHEARLTQLETETAYSKGFKTAVWAAIGLLTSGGVIELIRKGF